MILTLLLLYVVPALIVLYYEIRDLMWLRKRHMSVKSKLKPMACRVLIPIYNFIMALVFIAYDIETRRNNIRQD